MSDAARILIIEDDNDIQNLLKRLFKKEGYDVRSASNGVEGLEHLRNAEQEGRLPELIFLDLMMPIMDGFEFRADQRKSPNWSRIPVVVMTADEQLETYKDRLAADEYLQKPLDIDTLLGVSRRLARLSVV